MQHAMCKVFPHKEWHIDSPAVHPCWRHMCANVQPADHTNSNAPAFQNLASALANVHGRMDGSPATRPQFAAAQQILPAAA